MALSVLLYIDPRPTLSLQPLQPSLFSSRPRKAHILYRNPNPNPKTSKMLLQRANAVPLQGAVSEAMNLIQSVPPTWQSALLSNILIFVLGSPILVSGLSLSGIGAAFLLGTLTWRAFGSSGFLLVASYFVIVSLNYTMHAPIL